MDGSPEEDVLKVGEHYRGYVVERVLGHGGVGAVYLVRHEILDTPFAMKILYPKVAEEDPDYVKRFVREARIAIKIRHPNLVAVHGCGFDQERGVYYLVMDYVQGGDLRTALGFAGKFTPDRAAKIILQVASALAAAQKYAVVHRDIKPENIMLLPDGTVKLIDLGIAKATGLGDTLATATQSVFGTPVYISPEQATDSADVDHRADIYSLGIVFFEMVSGTCPYTEGNSAQILAKVLSDEPMPDVRDFCRDVPPSVAALIRRMCHKDRDRRIPDYPTLAAELNRLGYDFSSLPTATAGYSADPEMRPTMKIGKLVENLPPNNPTLSFDTEDIEIQDFVAQLKKKKRRGFFARIFAALTGRD